MTLLVSSAKMLQPESLADDTSVYVHDARYRAWPCVHTHNVAVCPRTCSNLYANPHRSLPHRRVGLGAVRKSRPLFPGRKPSGVIQY